MTIPTRHATYYPIVEVYNTWIFNLQVIAIAEETTDRYALVSTAADDSIDLPLGNDMTLDEVHDWAHRGAYDRVY